MSQKNDITKELAEIDSAKEIASQSELVLSCFAIGISLCCLFFSYTYFNDDEIQVFKCPVVREMDAPVAMRKIDDINTYDAEVFIRGFVRQYIRAMYPKNSGEVVGHYTFAHNHSLGEEKRTYAGFLKDSEKIGKNLDSGMTTDFFPMNSLDMRISRNNLGESWIVEIDGFLNNRHSAIEDDRGAVTLRLEVVKESARVGGSHSGLYVSSIEILTMTDAVANNTKNVK